MLTGENTLIFNQETMKKILDHYFETVLFARGRAPKALSVSQVATQIVLIEGGGGGGGGGGYSPGPKPTSNAAFSVTVKEPAPAEDD